METKQHACELNGSTKKNQRGNLKNALRQMKMKAQHSQIYGFWQKQF